MPVSRNGPVVTCGSCHHFKRDIINPPTGMGNCRLKRQFKNREQQYWEETLSPMGGRGYPPWPFTERICDRWLDITKPKPEPARKPSGPAAPSAQT